MPSKFLCEYTISVDNKDREEACVNTIKLSVSDENLTTVMTILENLKSGLIDNIQTDSKAKRRTSQYKPKTNKVIYEQESGTNDTSGKYSVSAYKARLKKR